VTRVNVAEAKARLSELIDAALDGEDVVIARRNKPLVKLVAVRAGADAPVRGLFRGRIWMSPDFDEPLAEFAEYMAPKTSKRKPRRRG
jgi:prevent-host-death family protein